MKILPILAAAIITTASFSALAATQITSAQADSGNYQPLGVVSVSQMSGAPGSIKEQLNAQATDKGASHYRVIGMSSPGDSSLERTSVELYR
ncbi:DUF1471 domain-containing protein [Ewingella sp. S1.OA.A_B6]